MRKRCCDYLSKINIDETLRIISRTNFYIHVFSFLQYESFEITLQCRALNRQINVYRLEKKDDIACIVVKQTTCS